MDNWTIQVKGDTTYFEHKEKPVPKQSIVLCPDFVFKTPGGSYTEKIINDNNTYSVVFKESNGDIRWIKTYQASTNMLLTVVANPIEMVWDPVKERYVNKK